ncbi:cytospin-B isoform X2 [Conger conger]|uniref:cytospin-B isoform X2 n=1 Tax=Conger conger TaxID=82655 RepID=UPI002A5ACC8F|nr:cytospin-B isoform X2 [Conger conger]
MGNQAGRLEELEQGVPSAKKSGIPAPKEMAPTITRDRISLRDQLRTSGPKKMLPSASASTLSALSKHPRASQKPGEAGDKALLECQVKELLAEAKAKEFEISKLRTELQRSRGRAAPEGGSPDGPEATPGLLEAQPAEVRALVGALREKNGRFQRELAALREENQALKEKLLSLEPSPASSGSSPASLASPAKPSLNGMLPDPNDPPTANGEGPLKTSTSSSSDITKGSPSPDSSEFEKIPSRSDSASSAGLVVGGDGRRSLGTRDLSVECLTEQIQKMEESHHSTAEELQATLQELSDQQQVVQELTAENERLAEEKGLLQTSLQQQRERVEALAQKNEALLGRLQEQAKSQEAEARSARVAELEQRYAELVESSRFEREKLVDIQQQLSGSLRALEKEHQEAQGQVRTLREEKELLQSRLEKDREASGEAGRALEALRGENGRLRVQAEAERQKAQELKAAQGPGGGAEMQGLLEAAHGEKEQLELGCGELRQELARAVAETERVQSLLAKAEAECQRLQQHSEQQEQARSSSVHSLEERLQEQETQVKDLKDTIFELEDQVEQHTAVRLHTNQTILDLENKIKKLEDQKFELEKQLKALSKQIKDETEEWQRFQADLQTAVVVANDIKVEAQQELRGLRRRLQEEQEHSAKLAGELEQLQGSRSKGEEAGSPDADSAPHWCGISMSQTSPPNGGEHGATVKSLIKSFDSAVQSGPGHTVQVHSSPRSPLSGIPVRTAPAAAVSPIQRLSSIKPLSKTLEKRINHGDFSHPDRLTGPGEELKPSSLMRKSPSLESVIKTPATLSSRTSSFSYNKANSKLSVERRDPLAALAREYGGSKRNALLKWCQKKTEGYPNIDVTNFSSSWSDGLAFCALLHTYLPAHIPYQELISQDKNRNLTLAFQAAESVGIKPSLDISEMMHTDRPDWQSVMQYVSQIYKYFET